MNVPLVNPSLNIIPLRTECIGRVLIDLPSRSVKRWSQEFDQAKVSRVSYPTGDDAAFWIDVTKRKEKLEASPHKTEGSLLSKYEKVGENAAILLFRSSDIGVRLYKMERFLWLGHLGYVFESNILNDEKDRLSPYTEVFSKLEPRNNLEIPSEPGFCIDGALVSGDVGGISASQNFKVAGWKNVYLWASAGEVGATPTDSSGDDEDHSFDADLKREQEGIREIVEAAPEARNDPAYPKEFDVLRQHDRDLNGLGGREVIWRKKLNSGALLYTFRWETSGKDQGTPQHPGASIGMDVGDEHHPEQTPPAEKELFALWDAVLTSLKRRPGTP